MNIKVRYLCEDLEPLRYVDGKSDWIDLQASETVVLKAGEFRLIPLGVAVALPDGYEAHIVPRSSTFKNYGILQTNSMCLALWAASTNRSWPPIPTFITARIGLESPAWSWPLRIIFGARTASV